MVLNYKEVRGALIKKYRNILGRYIFLIEENCTKTKISVGKSIYENAKVGTHLTIGHIKGRLVNVRPGFCNGADE